MLIPGCQTKKKVMVAKQTWEFYEQLRHQQTEDLRTNNSWSSPQVIYSKCARYVCSKRKKGGGVKVGYSKAILLRFVPFVLHLETK